MALWGKYDDKTSTGTVQIYANGLVAGTSTLLDTEAEVGDYINANSKDYRITAIRSNTNVQVVAGTLGGTISAVAAGNNFTLSEKPIYVSASQVGTDSNNVFGVSTGEATAARTEASTDRVAHAGWVYRTTGTGGRSGRVFSEVLVAGSSITNDAEDVVFEDYVIVINTQPSDTSANTTASENATFTVAAATSPSGGTLSYQWQYANGDTIQAGANVGNTTQTTLTVNSAVENANADFNVVISVTGGDDVTSSNATLTITT